MAERRLISIVGLTVATLRVGFEGAFELGGGGVHTFIASAAFVDDVALRVFTLRP